MEAGRKSNKIRDIVRLHQLLKKWRKQAKASRTNNNGGTTTTNNNNNKGINKFLKKTLSFSENSVVHSVSSVLSNSDYVPKGYLAVSVGREEDEKRRYVIPTEYLGHQAFGILLREAEEEFGFQQQGVLQIPCEVALFESIVGLLEENNNNNNTNHSKKSRRDHDQEMFFHHFHASAVDCNSSPECNYQHNILQSSHAQLCR